MPALNYKMQFIYNQLNSISDMFKASVDTCRDVASRKNGREIKRALSFNC